MGVVPSTVGVVPTMVGLVPRMVGLVPSMVGVVRIMMGLVPSMVGVVPSMVGLIPRMVGVVREVVATETGSCDGAIPNPESSLAYLWMGFGHVPDQTDLSRGGSAPGMENVVFNGVIAGEGEATVVEALRQARKWTNC